MSAGDVLGTVQETAVVEQKIMVPYGLSGTVKEIKAGEFTVEEVVAVLSTKDGDKELTMMQKWPVRKGRPYVKKLPLDATACNRTASSRYLLPNCKRWCSCCSGTFRKW